MHLEMMGVWTNSQTIPSLEMFWKVSSVTVAAATAICGPTDDFPTSAYACAPIASYTVCVGWNAKYSQPPLPPVPKPLYFNIPMSTHASIYGPDFNPNNRGPALTGTANYASAPAPTGRSISNNCKMESECPKKKSSTHSVYLMEECNLKASRISELGLQLVLVPADEELGCYLTQDTDKDLNRMVEDLAWYEAI